MVRQDRSRRRLALLGLLLVATAALAGCAGGRYGNANPAPENTVDASDSGFDPASITVSVNQTVMWTNVGQDVHRIESTSGPANFSSLDLKPGDRFTYTPTMPGVYEYRCQRHPEHTGEVIVRSA